MSPGESTHDTKPRSHASCSKAPRSLIWVEPGFQSPGGLGLLLTTAFHHLPTAPKEHLGRLTVHVGRIAKQHHGEMSYVSFCADPGKPENKGFLEEKPYTGLGLRSSDRF